MRPISICWSDSTWRAKTPASGSAPPPRGVELLHHRQRALVVADHEAEEKAVEGGAARRGEPLHVRVGQHPGHEHAAGAVGVPVHAVPDGRLLAP